MTAQVVGSRSGVVVGVDGSAGSGQALKWAVAEARLRGAPLTVVHAWHQTSPVSFVGGYLGTPMLYDVDLFEKAAQQVLDEAVDSVDTTGLADPVVRKVIQDGASAALVGASSDADLLVVGARGVGGFPGLLVGSVTTQVTHHASCPVVVVPA